MEDTVSGLIAFRIGCMCTIRFLWAVTTALAASVPLHAAAQDRTDRIQGRVTAADGAAIRMARIIVTRGPDRATFQTLSNAAGRYEVAIDSGTGDYLVYVAAPPEMALKAFRLRVTRQAAADSVFIVDAVLQASAPTQQLSTITVRGEKQTPSRVEGSWIGPGGSESPPAGGSAALLPEQLGDLGASAASIAGISPVTGGVSVFGLPSSQNAITLNGLAFPSATVPRDAMTKVRVVTTTYDPSRGWFGGAETRVDLAHDFLFSSLSTSSSVDAPTMQSRTASSERSGQNFTNVSLGGGATGRLGNGKLTYNLSAQAARRTSDIATLEDLDGEVLQHAGVSRDSVTRLLQVARLGGIPVSVSNAPASPVTTRASVLVGVSTLPYDRDTFEKRRHVGTLTAYLARNETAGVGLQSLATQSTSGSARTTVGSLQATLSSYVSPQILLEVRSAISVGEQHASPILTQPSASVLVGSAFPDATGGLATVSLGGASTAVSTGHTWTWETQSDTRFYAFAGHRMRVSADVRYDATSRREGVNNGTFAFNSLGDLASNRPSIFSRILSAPAGRGGVWNGVAAVGDYWHPVPAFELLYGARMEGNLYATHADYNPTVDSVFGARTDYAPTLLHVSPRLGFTWTYNQSKPGGGGVYSDHGVYLAPSVGVLRGGVGEFRALMTPELLTDVTINTGLPNGLRQVTCVGPSVPIPDWNAYLISPAQVPNDCAPGVNGTAWRDGESPVRLVARGFKAPSSWRANLSWTSYHDAVVWMIDGAMSLNVNQPGQVDLNFNGTPAALLAYEGGRPLFVPPASIVPTTGVVFARDARRNTDFGPVLQSRSNVRSAVSQLTLTVMPDIARLARARYFTSVSYTLASSRARLDGFSESTFLAPATMFWTRGSYVSRHAVLVQASVRSRYVTFGIFGRLASGLSYTPLVGSDINGDGLVNDRAFVPNPATTDAATAVAMRALLEKSPRGVSDCLRRQLGRAASANSCEGPWTTTVNARLQLNTRASAGWAKRVTASLYFANPLAGLDQLLHGASLHGWGSDAIPNRTLLTVDGFDLATTRYRYAVNPRFGTTRTGDNLLATPFRVTLDVRVSLAVPVEQQILDRSLQPGRGSYGGTKRTAEQIKRFYLRTIPRPFAAVMELSDSLLLTTDQLRAMLVGQARYDARVDTVVSAYSQWLSDRPDRYDATEALRRQNELLEVVVNIGREEVQVTMRPLLSAIQIKLLPWPVDIMIHATGPLTVRDIRR